ncbi:MAG: ion transporter [Desulfobacterales bacterium]|nr:ion transporter [Desulfobacterales bacterium]
MSSTYPDGKNWRNTLHEIIFEADTPAGKGFDILLLILILFSTAAVILESVASIRNAIGPALRIVEWAITLIFTLEYILRLLAVKQPLSYARSFFGIVDLLAILPTWLSLVFVGTHSLAVIRALRLLRVFRILKLAHFLREARLLRSAIKASMGKITVFLGTISTLVIIIGALMYLIEGEENGFTNIPQSIYWAIVTMTTVGYGDIAPATVPGKMLASLVMIIGYGIIAVPTGIVTAELVRPLQTKVSTQACPSCSAEGHDPDAKFCKDCGNPL